MKLEIPVKADFDDIQDMIDEIKRLQTYKLFEGDDMVLVDIDAVVAIMVNHIRATDNSSESPSGWIPCSERLPEEDVYVLISKKPSPISGNKFSVTIGMRYINRRSKKAEWRDSGFGYLSDDKVLAWMPLPEPYQEEGE